MSVDFAAVLAEESKVRAGNRLKVDVILDALDDATREQVRTALGSDANASALARALGKIGYPVCEGAIRTWRERQ